MGLWHMILQLRKRALTNPAITVVFCMGVVGHGVPPFGSPKGTHLLQYSFLHFELLATL
ncbi:hypothetical protein HanHA89_Chr10g0372561 [Helianthus annuus]|nr:hypothetical protein HanHA89_Chr10g0372561 [Helianthus annuus]